MIVLSKYEKMWIKMCKGHYKEHYPYTGKWTKTLMPLFHKIYGWDPKTDYHTYCNVLFEKLFDIYLKIRLDQSGSNLDIKDIFSAAFYKSIGRPDSKPIERAISQLCGLIQSNQVIETIDKIGYERYNLYSLDIIEMDK